jgi:hypothetical protein
LRILTQAARVKDKDHVCTQELNHILSSYGLLRQPNNQENNSGQRRRITRRSKGAEQMRFLIGVFVGYSLRDENKLLMTLLAIVLLINYVIVPTAALVALRLDVQRQRQSRLAQTKVPSIKGLSYQEAETKLHASNLNIRLLATRCDLLIQPGLVIDQVPQPGEEVVYGHAVSVTITEADSHVYGPR